MPSRPRQRTGLLAPDREEALDLGEHGVLVTGKRQVIITGPDDLIGDIDAATAGIVNTRMGRGPR
jgi:hypothetical protein